MSQPVLRALSVLLQNRDGYALQHQHAKEKPAEERIIQAINVQRKVIAEVIGTGDLSVAESYNRCTSLFFGTHHMALEWCSK